MKTQFLLFLLFLFSFACQSPKNNRLDRTVVVCKYKVVESDSIVIPPDYSTNYEIFKNVRLSNTDYQIGYNAGRNQLEFINLSAKRVAPEKNIDLSRIDERGIKLVNDFLYYDDDAIFIVSETAIYKIDPSGTLLDKWLINRIDSPIKGINFEAYTLSPNPYCPIDYNEEKDVLYIHCRSLLHSQFDFDYFETPLLASIDLASSQATLLPLHYPAYMLEKRYGLAHRPRFTFTEEQVIVGFDHQSDCKVFNLSKQTTKEIALPTLNAPEKAEPFTGPNDPIAFMEHAETNPSYLSNITVPIKNSLIRPFFAPRPAGKTFGRGKLHLSIWSVNEPEVREVEVPGYFNPQHYFVSSKGVGFKNMQQSTDEMLVINYIEYDCP